jgi:hypothetical protein
MISHFLFFVNHASNLIRVLFRCFCIWPTLPLEHLYLYVNPSRQKCCSIFFRLCTYLQIAKKLLQSVPKRSIGHLYHFLEFQPIWPSSITKPRYLPTYLCKCTRNSSTDPHGHYENACLHEQWKSLSHDAAWRRYVRNNPDCGVQQ